MSIQFPTGPPGCNTLRVGWVRQVSYEHMTNMCNTTDEWCFKYVKHHSCVVFQICAAPETRGVAPVTPPVPQRLIICRICGVADGAPPISQDSIHNSGLAYWHTCKFRVTYLCAFIWKYVLRSLPLNAASWGCRAELSTGQMDPRVWSGRVTILPKFGKSGRSALRILQFLLIISWFLNRYESSNITFGLIDLVWYLIYNN